jgi:hypothetical protein
MISNEEELGEFSCMNSLRLYRDEAPEYAATHAMTPEIANS